MFCVALTGNIATGKSTVCEQFKKYGADIINADDISRQLTEQGSPAYHAIVQHFNDSILLPDNRLDRKKLRSIIFSKPEEKIWLETLLHPLIRQRIEETASASKANLIIIEIPLHFDREAYPFIERVILVHAPESIQIKRIMERDNCSEQQAKMMLHKQPNLKKRLSISDDVIYNQGDIEDLKQQVSDLYKKYQSYISK